MNSIDLITNPTLRAEHIERVEVLNRVGGLLLLPNTELATTKQVAEFYGVPINTVYSLININREELENNGMKNMGYLELKELISKPLESKGLEKQPDIQLSKRGATVFNTRAILLVGFMLRDSKVAQEVRNQVLNIVETATEEHKTYEITKEKQMLMAIMFASNEVERATAINQHLEYVNRHKKEMEKMIEKQGAEIDHKQKVIHTLTEKTSIAEKRQFLNKVIRKGAYNSTLVNSRWLLLYEQFDMKYHMNVNTRKRNYENQTGRKMSTLDFIEKQLGMFDELYELAMKFFESEVKAILSEMEKALSAN